MKLRWSIRTHLFLLVVMVALPLTALVAYNIYRNFLDDREAATASAVRLAQVSSAEASQVIRETQTLLITLSQRPLVRALDPRRCDPLFRDFPDLYPRFATVLTVDLSGKPVCGAIPLPARETATRAPSYNLQELARTDKFTIGKPIVGPLTGKWVVVLAHPLHDQTGRLSGAVGLPIDLVNFYSLAGGVALPPGTSIRIVTGEGIVIASLRDPATWIGTDARGAEIVDIVLARKKGEARAVGNDGIERIYGFMPVPETDWYAYAGIPVSAAFADARKRILQSAAIGALLVALAVAFATFMARALAAPVQAMAETARDISRGNTNARFRGERPTEIVEVATEFNRALDTLAKNERRLSESENQLRGILTTTMEGVISVDEQQRIVLFNPAAEQIFGRSREEMNGQPLGALIPERFRAQHDEHIRKFAAGGQTSRAMGQYGEITGLRADGEEIAIEATISQLGVSPDKLLTVILHDVTERRRAVALLRAHGERLQALSRRLMQVEENERRRLARELHDRIGQNVAALSLNLNMVRSELPEDCRQKLKTRLEDCDTLLFSTAKLVRDVMADLRPPGLDELGLVAALTEHARQVAGRGGLSVTVNGTEVSPRLPPATEITLFRIAQEALINVAKHAQATEVALTLESRPAAVVLTITDNGRGFDAAARLVQPTSSLGMVSMRERAESIGARLSVESAPGHGTRVIVEAPRADPTAADQPNLPGIEPA